MADEGRRSAERSGIAQVLRDHPVITGVVVGCTLLGGVLGIYLLTGEWSVARRVAGGAVAGAGVGLIITATRIIG